MKFIRISSPLLLFLAAIFTFGAWGCYYDSVEDLYPVSFKGCDTSNVTYSNDVEPFFRTNCYSCHGIGVSLGGITLEGITNLTTVSTSGKLMGSLSHATGYIAMPPSGPKTDDCTLGKINAWIRQGHPAN